MSHLPHGELPQGFWGVAHDLAELWIHAKEVSGFRGVGNPSRRFCEGQPVTLLTFAQGPFKSLAALEDFLHVDVGCRSLGHEIAEKQLSLSHPINAVKQILRNGSLYDVPARACIKSLPHHLGRFVLAENQDID